MSDRSWPYDGPHDADTVTTAADELAYLIRYLNNATLPHRTHVLEYAATVNAVVAELAAAVHRLDQLLDQLASALQRQPTSTNLYDDRRDRPASQTAGEAVAQLTEARRRASALAAALQAAQSATCHLGNDR